MKVCRKRLIDLQPHQILQDYGVKESYYNLQLVITTTTTMVPPLKKDLTTNEYNHNNIGVSTRILLPPSLGYHSHIVMTSYNLGP